MSTLTVYLRNGLVFTFTPSEPGLPAPSENAIAKMMEKEDAIEAVALAQPRIVLRWREVVAVQIDETPATQRARARRRAIQP